MTEIKMKILLLTQRTAIEEDVQLKDGEFKVPAVMMVEGVHCGNKGAILHTAEYLAADAEKWNGKPVVISHPQNAQGEYISAFSEGVIHVGKIHNARFEDEKLKADLILHETKLTAASPTALSYIKENRPLDVSIGAFTEEMQVAGEWNGENYESVTTAYSPDHLALLPGEPGACSWNDGCGIRVNKNNVDVEFTDDPQRVQKKVEYSAISTNQRRQEKIVNNEKRKEKEMSKNSDLVDRLIANPLSNFAEADRENLLAQSECFLTKAMPKEPQANKEVSKEVVEKTIATYKQEDIIAIMPDGVKKSVEQGLKLYSEKREELITDIQANTAKDTWNKDELTAMSMGMLEKLQKSINKPANYSGSEDPPGVPNDGDDEEPMAVNMAVETEK